ncbi:hypothetical protein I3843_04G059300 [Carya illinoinensis]|nr:hypothetical protein I3843_04G059300 [Carya illinoinensis]
MGIHSSSLLTVFFIILLASALPSSCRQINRTLDDETEPRIRTKPSSPFPRHQPSTVAQSAAFRDNKVKHVHIVSHPRVPGGPNPLHN